MTGDSGGAGAPGTPPTLRPAAATVAAASTAGKSVNAEARRANALTASAPSLRAGISSTFSFGIGFPQVVNLIILLAKQFISTQRGRGLVNTDLFLSGLKSAFNMEKLTATQKRNMHKFAEKWAGFISATGDLEL